MTSMDGDSIIIDIFDNWFKHYTEVTNQLADVEENLKRATMQIETLTKANARLQSDEVQHLKQKIAEKEQALLNESAQNTATVDSMKQFHENEKKSLLANMKAEYDTKLTDLDNQLKMEIEGKHSLLTQLEDLTRDKVKEVSRITMESQQTKADQDPSPPPRGGSGNRVASLQSGRESMDRIEKYESKLIKAHRQKAQYIEQQQQILNQDVMRKKMQHMKENYEVEIAALKSQIQDMKHMLESLHQERQGKDHDDNFCEQQPPKLQPQKLYLQERQPPRQRGQLSHQDQRNVSKYRSGSKIKL